MKSFPERLALATGLLLSPAWGFVWPDCSKPPLSNVAVCNTALSPADRAAALVAALNITEKLNQLVDAAAGSTRLGLPPYEWWNEALHGVASSPGVTFKTNGSEFIYATSFPMPIVLSAAFDDNLINEVATTISTEARAFANAGLAGLDFFTPNINAYRDPRWGRGSETPGEDPFRIKGYVKALLEGLQGDEATRRVTATCKHFAGYDIEDWDGFVRYGYNAIISIQDLSEYYLPPFQQCSRDSSVGSIMCSYNAINGTPACANSYIMEDILRDHWNWTIDNNYITSDCNAILDIVANHFYVATMQEGTAVAYNAGMDTACDVPGPWPQTDPAGAYNQSLLSNATIDRALSRLYEALTLTGYFDPPTAAYRSLGWSDVSTPAAEALALQAALEGFVLKKNAGSVLPIDLSGKSVAIIGLWANDTANMLGGYSGTPPYYHNPLYAAQALGLKTYYANGPIAQNSSVTDTWTAPALEAASQADVVVYAGGNDNSIEAEAMDRNNITWPQVQLDLIEKLSKLGKPLIVAELGDQDDDTPLLNSPGVSAIVWCGFPGQSGGTALFDIITGKSAPAGRLPVTQYPGDYANEQNMTNQALRPNPPLFPGAPGRTYRWYDQAVLPFGFGLHYTTFAVAFKKNCLAASFSIQELLSSCKGVAHADLCPFPSVAITVANTGSKVTSDFVALAFVTGKYGPAPYPIKSLAAYSRLTAIAPHSTASASLTLNLGALARVDDSGNLVLYPGEYTLMLDVPTQDTATFTLTGQQAVLDQFPQPPA